MSSSRMVLALGIVTGALCFLLAGGHTTLAGELVADPVGLHQPVPRVPSTLPFAHLVLDSGLAEYTPEAGISGRLTITGSDTMRPLLAKLAAEFMLLHPGVTFAIEGTGSATAIREFSLGLSLQRRGDKGRVGGHAGANIVDLLASSRALTVEELGNYVSHHGEEPLTFPIAMDAVTIYVNAQNPIQSLTLDQVDAIFSSTRKRGFTEDVTTWGQVGLPGGWEKEMIHLYGRNKASGTREFFIQKALQGGSLKDTVIEQPGTASEILAIARDPLGIGYAGTGFQTALVRVVPIADRPGHAAVLPSPESVVDGTYPLGRTLYLYVAKKKDKSLDPAIAAFLRFISSREGQTAVTRAGFFPVTQGIAAKNLEVLKGQTVAIRLSGVVQAR